MTDREPTTGTPSTSGACSDCTDLGRTTLHRRQFLSRTAAVGAGAVATSLFGDTVRQAAFGAEPGGNVLVVISLRGGLDGLGLVVPYGDPGLAQARPNIMLPKETLLARDELFGLHPAMRPLAWAWDAGELAAVHAVGMPAPNRSHFSAMEEIEDADPTSSVRRGWINRMAGLNAFADPLEVVHLGSSVAPTIVSGTAPHVAAPRLSDVGLIGADGSATTRRMRQLRTAWAGAKGPLATAARAALDTTQRASSVAATTYKPRNGVTYPTAWPGRDFADALQDTAQLIRSDLGTEIVSIDFGSWDMHADYGNADGGAMTTMVHAFASGLDAFLRDLGGLRSRVTVVTISEFGRRLGENGNRGLDHGWGNVMLLAGAGVRGGRYHGRWPGLGPSALTEGDLAVTTDYRDVLAEVLQRRFPQRSVGKVFPGLRHTPVGVMRA